MHSDLQNNRQPWIIGCGDIGQRVARLYQKQGIQTRATVQSKESLQQCHQQNIAAIALNLDHAPEPISATLNPHHFNDTDVFYFAPPTKIGYTDTRIQSFLTALSDNNQKPRRMVLISTTGVYGDCNGAWVNETSAVNPTADRAKRRLDAEQRVVQWCQQQPAEWVILRVPGIYALDRLPIARLQQQAPILERKAAPFTNRIHADDLAMICKTAMDSTDSASGELYNACDSLPSTMTDYFNAVADYAGLARPPQINWQQAQQQMSAGMLSYLKESRRISNAKMLNQLKVKLRYPTLADALKK